MAWPVWFLRLDRSGEDPVDLHSCKRFIVGISFATCPGGQMVDPTTASVYYLTPDGRWVCALGGFRMRPGDEGYIEVHPAHVARYMLLRGTTLPPELTSTLRPLPRWDRAALRLTFGEALCRHYSRDNAKNQFQLLNAFETESWPSSICSPFPLDRTLRETVDDLRKGLEVGSPITFRVADGRPVWELVS